MYEFIDVLLPSLAQIISDSLTAGVVPPDYKTAVVKLLLKKQGLDPNNLKNYSLYPTFQPGHDERHRDGICCMHLESERDGVFPVTLGGSNRTCSH